MRVNYRTATRDELINATLDNVEREAPTMLREWAERYLDTWDTADLREWFAMDDTEPDPGLPHILSEDVAP